MPPSNDRVGAGFTEGELQFASFWVRNKLVIQQFTLGALIVANTLLWGYVGWGLLDAYVISYPRESRIVQDIAQNQFLAAQFEVNRPQSVSVSAVQVFEGTENRLDFLVDAANPNTEWWTTFTYRFNVGGELTPKRAGFLLPGQRRFVGEFGFLPSGAGARSGTFVVDDVRWHRIDPAVVGADYPAWVERYNQFGAEDIQFLPDQISGTTRVSRTQFTFRNPSAYGFWSVQLYVLLRRGNDIVAANAVTLDRVEPGEARPVSLDWFERLPGITETEIQPLVNFLDPSVLIPTTQLDYAPPVSSPPL